MPLILPNDYEKIQTTKTSKSRNTKNGVRVEENVFELSKFIKPPILCIGCGDGLEIECFIKKFNIQPTEEYILGMDVSSSKLDVARSFGLPVVNSSAENMMEVIDKDKKYNIYSAHTLEHSFDIRVVIDNYKAVALDTVIIIVPIERRGSGNIAHYSPIKNLGYIANLFGMNWKIITYYRFHLELEGVLIAKKNNVNWPENHRNDNSEFVYQGSF